MTKTKTAPKARTKPTRTNQPIDHATFIKTWQKAATVGDAAKTLGWEPQKASSTARFLRLKGLKLKTFTRGSKIDVDALKKLL